VADVNVLFDLDGTLTDPREGILAHVHAGRIMDERKRRASLRDHGVDFADERVHVISFQRATRHDERFLFKSL
jgi:phosphoglycolate phosphatase-like HAD superfamily hydrolase